MDFAKREGYIVLEQLTSYCSLFFFVFWTSIYSWLVQKLLQNIENCLTKEQRYDCWAIWLHSLGVRDFKKWLWNCLVWYRKYFSHQMSNMPYHDGHRGENVAWKANSHYFLSRSFSWLFTIISTHLLKHQFMLSINLNVLMSGYPIKHSVLCFIYSVKSIQMTTCGPWKSGLSCSNPG